MPLEFSREPFNHSPGVAVNRKLAQESFPDLHNLQGAARGCLPRGLSGTFIPQPTDRAQTSLLPAATVRAIGDLPDSHLYENHSMRDIATAMTAAAPPSVDNVLPAPVARVNALPLRRSLQLIAEIDSPPLTEERATLLTTLEELSGVPVLQKGRPPHMAIGQLMLSPYDHSLAIDALQNWQGAAEYKLTLRPAEGVLCVIPPDI